MRLPLLALALASCTVAPLDLYPEAARSAANGQLLRALALLEQIPPAHPRRAECLRLALEVEQRIQAAQTRVAEALELQAAGFRARAVDVLAAVRREWPEATSLAAIVEVSLPADAPAAAPGPEPVGPAPAGPAAAESPARATVASVPQPAPTFDSPAAPDVPLPPVVPDELIAVRAESPSPALDRSNPGPPLDPTLPDNSVADAAVDIALLRALVHGRDLPTAIAKLDAAQRSEPQNQEVIELLTGLLRNRALVAYGRGWLEAAVEDWGRVNALCPNDREVSAHLTAAQAELARREVNSPRAGRKKCRRVNFGKREEGESSFYVRGGQPPAHVLRAAFACSSHADAACSAACSGTPKHW